MSAHAHVAPVDYAALGDHALVALVRDGHREAFRHIMQRCNQRLFRVARAVIGEDSEAEDVLQESYMRAYHKLDSFRGDSTLLTWLTSIVLNEARGRLRKRHTMVGLEQVDVAMDDSHQIIQFPSKHPGGDHERGVPVHGPALRPRCRRGDGAAGRRTDRLMCSRPTP